MTQTEHLTSAIDRAALAKRMLVGGSIALAFILLFTLPVRDPDPEWGKYWIVRPLIITPLAGAVGGACFYFITRRYPSGAKKVAAVGLALLVYLIGLWMGMVLGLDGTLWD
jgi:hypothetical protein